MKKYMQKIINTLNDWDFHFNVIDEDGVVVNLRGDHCPHMSIVITCTELSNTTVLNISVPKIVSLSNKISDALPILNEINREYRWAKFVIDENQDLLCSLESHINEEDFLYQFRLMFLVITTAIDETYPKFMKLIWG